MHLFVLAPLSVGLGIIKGNTQDLRKSLGSKGAPKASSFIHCQIIFIQKPGSDPDCTRVCTKVSSLTQGCKADLNPACLQHIQYDVFDTEESAEEF